jgi:hypothetical protein
MAQADASRAEKAIESDGKRITAAKSGKHDTITDTTPAATTGNTYGNNAMPFIHAENMMILG